MPHSGYAIVKVPRIKRGAFTYLGVTCEHFNTVIARC